MPKKKSNLKKNGKSLNFKLFIIVGAIFNLVVYLLIDLTFYNDSLFWWSLICCGIISGIYFIKKMKLMHPDSYKKIEGTKLKIYMFFIFLFTIIGTTIIFGNFINATILGLNYVGKSNDLKKDEYIIQEITHQKSTGRKGRKRRLFRRNNPKVCLEKDGTVIGVNLSEDYNSNKDYSEYKKIEFDVSRGLFGFEIIDDYVLRK